MLTFNVIFNYLNLLPCGVIVVNGHGKVAMGLLKVVGLDLFKFVGSGEGYPGCHCLLAGFGLCEHLCHSWGEAWAY